jgi:hypothetical protein
LKKDGSLIKAKSDQLDNFLKANESYQGGEKLRNNIIPITTTKGGLLFIDEQLQIRSILNTSNGLDFDYVTSFIQDRVGDVWGTSDNIYRVYPHKLFCDTTIKDRCVTHDDKNIFYSDDDHPSIKGSEMINDLIMKEIEKIELKSN